MPSGKRSSETGRSPLAARNGLRHGDEVLRELVLGDAELGPEHAVRAREPDLAVAVGSGHGQGDALRRHASASPRPGRPASVTPARRAQRRSPSASFGTEPRGFAIGACRARDCVLRCARSAQDREPQVGDARRRDDDRRVAEPHSGGVDVREVAVPARPARSARGRSRPRRSVRPRAPARRSCRQRRRRCRSPAISCARAMAASMPSVTKCALPVCACAQSVGRLVGHARRTARRADARPSSRR